MTYKCVKCKCSKFIEIVENVTLYSEIIIDELYGGVCDVAWWKSFEDSTRSYICKNCHHKFKGIHSKKELSEFVAKSKGENTE